jgi:hypothetical protein
LVWSATLQTLFYIKPNPLAYFSILAESFFTPNKALTASAYGYQRSVRHPEVVSVRRNRPP